MKKLLCLLIIILLTSCQKSSIDTTLYVSSYHISYNEEYEITYNIITSDDNKTASAKGDSILYCHEILEKSFNMEVNFSYIKSVIFDESFFDDERILEFIEVIKENFFLDFNFFIFASSDDPLKIYDTINIASTDLNYTLYNNPNNKRYYLCSKALHFLDFTRDFLSEYETLIIPSIKSYDIVEDSINVASEGVHIYNGTIHHLSLNEYSSLILFSYNDYIIFKTDGNVYIKNYKHSIKYKKNLKFISKGKINDKDYISIIYDDLKILLDYCYNNNLDILNIKAINYRYNKNYSYNDLVIELFE